MMSDNQRRIICRVLFLLFCAVPTTGVAYRIIHRPSPADWQNRIDLCLGIESAIDSIETPTPNTTVLRGVVLRHQQSGKLLELKEIRIVNNNGLQIAVEHPIQLTCGAMTRLVRVLTDKLIESGDQFQPFRVTLQRVTLVPDAAVADPVDSLIAKQIEIEAAHSAEGVAALTRVRIAGDRSNNVVTCGIECTPHKTAYGLNTGTGYLPCWLLTGVLPELLAMGRHCQFAGQVVVEPAETGINGWFCGNLNNVDLASLTKPFRQLLTGDCHMAIENFEIKDGRLKSLDAVMTSKQGTLGQPLLSAAKNYLGFEIPDVHQFPPQIPYRNLDVRCRLVVGLLYLTSAQRKDGVLAMASDGQTLLSCANVHAHALEDFANFLVQPDETLQELSDEAVAVLRWFHHPVGVQTATDLNAAQQQNTWK